MWLHNVIDCRKDIGGWKVFQSLRALGTQSITPLTPAVVLHHASKSGSVIRSRLTFDKPQ